MTETTSENEPSPDPYRWTILVAATLAQAGTAFVFLGVGALAGFIQESFDLSGGQTGLLVTAVGTAPLAALIPTGRMLDRGLERSIITGGALLLGAGAALAAASTSYVTVLALLFVGGAGYSASQPGGSKVVAGWFAPRQRGLAMGIRQTGLPLGGALAAAVLPAIAGRTDWDTALLTGAAVAAASGVGFWLAYRPMPYATRSVPVGLGSELRGLLGAPPVRRAMLAGFAMVSVQFVLVSYLMLYLRDVHGIPLARGAWMLFATQTAGVAGRIVLAAWSDRLASRLTPVAVAASGAAVGAAVLAALSAGAGYAALLWLSAAIGFFAFGWYGPWVVFVAEAAPHRAVGTTLALAMTANQLAIVVAPPVFGVLYDVTGGYRVPLAVTAALLAGVAIRLWWSGSSAGGQRPGS